MKKVTLLFFILYTVGYDSFAQKGGVHKINQFESDCFKGKAVAASIFLNGKVFENQLVAPNDTLEIRIYSKLTEQYSLKKLKVTTITIEGRKYVPPQVQESNIKKGWLTSTKKLNTSYGNPSIFKIAYKDLFGKSLTEKKCVEQVRVQLYSVSKKVKTSSGEVVESEVGEADFPYQCIIPIFNANLDKRCYDK